MRISDWSSDVCSSDLLCSAAIVALDRNFNAASQSPSTIALRSLLLCERFACTSTAFMFACTPHKAANVQPLFSTKQRHRYKPQKFFFIAAITSSCSTATALKSSSTRSEVHKYELQ